MGTKIQANAFLLDLNGSLSNVVMPIYHENRTFNNGHNPDSFTSISRKNRYLGYNLEEVRQTILEQESIFKNQLQELHRLYGRQRELMIDLKRRENREDDSKGKCLPVRPLNQDARRSLTFCETDLSKNSIFSERTDNFRFPYDRDSKLSLSAVQSSQQNTDALGFDLYFKRSNYQDRELSITNLKDKINDDLTLSRGEVSENPCSNFNLVMKDFFQSSPSGINRESFPCILGLKNERNGKGHLSEGNAEQKRFEKHSSVGDFCSGKSLSTEPRNELSHCLNTGTSVSRNKKKIFGVEISEGNEYPSNAATSNNISSTLDPNIEPCHENKHVVSFKSSSWNNNSCMQSCTTNANGGTNEKSTPDLKVEISSQKRISSDSDMNKTWLQGCSSIGLNLGDSHYQCTTRVPEKCLKNSDEMNSKHADFEGKKENPKNELPWFLKNSKVRDDFSKTKNSSYFMNLDSLQNYSENFFGKAGITEGKFQTISKKGMDENVQRHHHPETKDLVLNKGLNNCVSDFDLNMSVDEDDDPLTPSLPKCIVKIATTEIDLEAQSIIELETCPGEPEMSYEEGDKIAAEAIILISSSAKSNLVDPSADRLKWFADIISLDQSEAHDGEEPESVPDGMDYFEFMTLRLEDVKEEQQYCYEPVVSENTSDGEIGGAKLSKRDGRGRRRKDFQRDVLPGLVTLSRLEVMEDFQAFDELVKGEGGPVRNGRGRKRLGGRNTSPNMKVVCSGRARKAVCQLEEMRLTGWGKKTRRLPRQRCSTNGFLTFPVKC